MFKTIFDINWNLETYLKETLLDTTLRCDKLRTKKKLMLFVATIVSLLMEFGVVGKQNSFQYLIKEFECLNSAWY